eukprot:4365928-Amphidinium_carterae.1
MSEYLKGALTAKFVCNVAYLGKVAGIEALGDLAMEPSHASGNFAKHLDTQRKKWQEGMPKTHDVPMPAYLRCSADRGIHMLQLLSPHEVLVEEMKSLDMVRLQQDFEKVAPPAYWEHPCRVQGRAVVPIGLFIDAHPYTAGDSMLSIVMINLLTSRKHLLGAVRKRLLCGTKTNCGCGGWCSYFPMFHFLAWSLRGLRDGTYPMEPHSMQAAEGQTCKNCGELHGQPLGFTGLCLQLRGDLAEFTGGMGLVTWSSNANPCVLCKQNKKTWFGELGNRHCQRGLRLVESYESECRAGSVVVPMYAELWHLLETVLVADTKKGRVLSIDLGGQGLLKGDKLCPSQWQMDIWSRTMPERCVFFRGTGVVKHINPLLSSELGTCLSSACSLDIMHMWCLGIFQNYVLEVFWLVLESGVFKGGSMKQDALLMSKHLKAFYAKFRDEHPDVLLTTIDSFTMEHTLGGSRGKHLLRAKAHETLGLLRYSVCLLTEYQNEVEGGPRLLVGAECLLGMYCNLQLAPALVPEATLEECFKTHLSREKFWKNNRSPCCD